MGAAAKEGVGTLGALLNLYGEKRGSTQRAWADLRKRIDLVFKPLLAKPVASLAASDFQMLVDAYPSESQEVSLFAVSAPHSNGRPSAATWLAAWLNIHPPAPVKRRKRILTPNELSAVLPVSCRQPAVPTEQRCCSCC